MYLDTSHSGPYERHLLRQSYRLNGKVLHRTIANLSTCTKEEIEAIRLALRHKGNLQQLLSASPQFSLRQGLSVGAVWVVYELARELGIVKALGTGREAKLALWQIIARVIHQGSRLSAVRLAKVHAACDILNLDGFNEDDLYANLAWLHQHQASIEDRHFASMTSGPASESHRKDQREQKEQKEQNFYLYDVTSSYLEGTCNELAAFGYNRDGKKGRRQIVVGLLCDGIGRPLSVEVFAGNTPDAATFAGQVKKVAERFGGGQVTFVGDRGMIKSQQIEDLAGHGMHYITAITKPQIEALLSSGTLTMGLFDQELAEVVGTDGVRYVLRRNPIRAADMAASREGKFHSLQAMMDRENIYLEAHAKADVNKAVSRVTARCRKLRLDAWVNVEAQGRVIELKVDESAKQDQEKLDGCYVLKTDLTTEQADAQTVHRRYKDLAQVEQAFRISKTVQLEMRPLYVRTQASTRGHALVVMLAYRIVQELARRWCDLDMTVKEGLRQLEKICAMQLESNGRTHANCVPKPCETGEKLLAAAGVTLPEVLPSRGATVATRKKLPPRRLKR